MNRNAGHLLAAVLAVALVSASGCAAARETEPEFLYRDRLEGKTLISYRAFEEAYENDPLGNAAAYQLLRTEDGSSVNGGTAVTASEEDALLAYQAFLYDHPEAFWLDRSFYYRLSSEKEDAPDPIVSSRIEAVSLAPGIIPEEDFNSAKAEFERALKEWLAPLIARSSDLEKAEALYQLMTERVQYREEAVYDASFKTEHTAYGALVEKRAVCDGIALGYICLLKKNGIACAAVPGEVYGTRHVWVVFYADGRWREADPAWGILKGKAYFDLTTEEMNRDHSRETKGAGALAPIAESKQ